MNSVELGVFKFGVFMEPKSKWRPQIVGFFYDLRARKINLFIIMFLLILAIIGGRILTTKLISKSKKMSSYFTVVLDCGSTGTRVNVYQWMTSKDTEVYSKLPVVVRSFPDDINKNISCHNHCIQTQPGLHNFVDNKLRVRASIEPLIKYAEQQVPLNMHAATPIFILATAGMRRLALVDGEHVLENIESVVSEHGFLYRKDWIRILSGKEEAYYGWVALNFEMGMFRNLKLPTFGLLDLGGSSLQVVAEVDVSLEKEHEFRSTIGSSEYDVVAYSLPAFGLNEAFDRSIVMLSHTQALRQNASGMLEIRHPCLGSNYFQNYTCSGCFGLDSVKVKSVNSHVQGNEFNHVLLIGEQNWEQCKTLASSVATNLSSFEWSHQADRTKCVGLSSFGGLKINLTKTSHRVERYHALSGFFAIHESLNLSQRANMTSLHELGQRLCSVAGDDQTSIARPFCFRLTYLTSLIENTLCLSEVEIIFGPGNISWTLGAALLEGEFLWHQTDGSPSNFVALKYHILKFSPLFTFGLLSFHLAIIYFCQIKLPVLGRKIDASKTLPSYFFGRGQAD